MADAVPPAAGCRGGADTRWLLRHFVSVEVHPDELEVVELLTEIGRWPAGTVGTVINADETTALVEISDDRGHGLDFVSVPHAALAAADSPGS